MKNLFNSFRLWFIKRYLYSSDIYLVRYIAQSNVSGYLVIAKNPDDAMQKAADHTGIKPACCEVIQFKVENKFMYRFWFDLF